MFCSWAEAVMQKPLAIQKGDRVKDWETDGQKHGQTDGWTNPWIDKHTNLKGRVHATWKFSTEGPRLLLRFCDSVARGPFDRDFHHIHLLSQKKDENEINSKIVGVWNSDKKFVVEIRLLKILLKRSPWTRKKGNKRESKNWKELSEKRPRFIVWTKMRHATRSVFPFFFSLSFPNTNIVTMISLGGSALMLLKRTYASHEIPSAFFGSLFFFLNL